MNVLPVPIIVAQNEAVLPDGSPDPAHASDCGEACLSSTLHTHTGLRFSPGCIRQAMGLPETDGRSTGAELVQFLRSMGILAEAVDLSSAGVWGDLARSRHFGQYHIVLGNWIAPGLLHWELFYQRSSSMALSMDPWTGSYAKTAEQRVHDLYAGTVVTVRP